MTITKAYTHLDEKRRFLYTNLFQINTFIYTGKKHFAFLSYDTFYTLKKIILLINTINKQNFKNFEDIIFYVLNSKEIYYDFTSKVMKLENFRSFTLTNKLKNYNNIKYYYNTLNFESDYTEDEATLIITFLTLCNHFISVFYTNLYSFTPSNKNKHFYYQTLFLYKYKQLLTKIDYLIKQEDPVFFQKVKFNIELTKYNTVIDNNNDYYIDQTIKNKFTLSAPFLTLNSNSIYTYNKLQDQLYLYKIL